MRTLRPLAILATTAALGLTLSGCGAISGIFGGGGGEKLSYEDSPLNEYMSALYGGDLSPEAMQDEAEAQQVLMEESIAACMQAEGFEYIPLTGDNSGMSFDSGMEWEPDEREWVEKYGYGIFVWPGSEEPVEEGEEFTDPNQPYIDSLSESEQQAYFEVLSGPSPTEEQMNDPEFDWSSMDMGCQGKASEEIFDSNALDELYEQYEPLMEKMNGLYEELESLDSVVELDAKWSTCMEDAGFPGFEVQTDAQESFSNIQNELYENASGEEPDWENATEEEINAYYESTDPASSQEWKDAAADEIKTALADLDCREETDYSNAKLTAQFELEEQFIEDNEAELEAFRAAAEQVM